MNEQRITPAHTDIQRSSARAVVLPVPADTTSPGSALGNDDYQQPPRPRFPALAAIAAILLALGAVLAIAAPAQAATYRDLKSVRYGTCLYAYGDPLEDIYSKKCSTTPAKYGNWTVTNAGYYYGHPLWILKRQGGSCLGIVGDASSSHLYSSCSPTGSKNVWEVFTTTSGRYVLKSFGAYQSWRQHKCLNFTAAAGTGSVRLGACSLTSTSDQIYR